MKAKEISVTLGYERFKSSFLVVIGEKDLHRLIAGFRIKWFGIIFNFGVRHDADVHVGATFGASSGLFANGPRWSDCHVDISLFGFGIACELALITGKREEIELKIAPDVVGQPISWGPDGEMKKPLAVVVTLPKDDGVIQS